MTNAPREAGRPGCQRHANEPSIAATPDSPPIGHAWLVDVAGRYRRIIVAGHIAAAVAATQREAGHQVTVTRVALVELPGWPEPRLHRCGRPRRLDGHPCRAPVPNAGQACRLHRGRRS